MSNFKAHKVKVSTTPDTFYLLVFIIRKFSWILSYLCFRLKLKPNEVTSVGIAMAFLTAFFNLGGRYHVSCLTLALWLTFDAIDGELARAYKQESESGLILEKLNSDLLYILFIPSIAIAEFQKNNENSFHLNFAIFSCIIYATIRKFHNSPPSTINSSFPIWVKALFKDQIELRKNNLKLFTLFMFYRNVATQFGLLELLFFVLVFTNSSLHWYLAFYSYLYFLISFFTLTSLIYFSVKRQPRFGN